MKKIIVIALLLFAFGMSSQAQMIGATNSQGGYRPAGESPEYHQTGSLINFELGYTHAVSYGYQINPYLRAGVGLGLVVDYEFEKAALPVFGELRVSTPRHRFSLYADLKVGINVAKNGEPRGVYALQLGVSFRYFSVGAGIVNFGRNGYDDYFGPNLSFGWYLPVSNLRNKLF